MATAGKQCADDSATKKFMTDDGMILTLQTTMIKTTLTAVCRMDAPYIG